MTFFCRMIVATCCLFAFVSSSAMAADTDPSVPTGLVAEGANHGALLNWKDNPEPDVDGYYIMRKLGVGGSWSYLDFAEASDYEDDSGSNGSTYYYYVIARDEALNTSSYSAEAHATAGVDSTAPAVPIGLAASGGASKVSLGWNANSEPSMDGYYIMRKIGIGGSWSYLDFSEDTHYVDTGLSGGSTYYYYVTARDKYNQVSSYSSEASASPGTDTTSPATPTGITAYGGDGVATIDWADNSEPDLRGYYVMRKRTAGGSWEYQGFTDESRFTQGRLDHGVPYYWYVRAADDTDNVSSYSSEVSSTAEPTLLRVGVVSGADFADTGMMNMHEDMGSPDVRVEWEVDTDPSTLGSTFAAFDSRGIRPLVQAGFEDYIPSTGDVEDFCEGIADRYGPGGSAGLSDDSAVRYIEFGNETSYAYQSNTYLHADDYADRLETCAVAARAANPDVGVLAIADDHTGVGWVDDLYSEVPNLNDLIAGWTSHPYGPLGSSEVALDRVMTETAEHGSAHAVFVTEFGISTDDGEVLTNNYGWDTDMTFAEAADGVEDTLEFWASEYPRLQQAYWYKSNDQCSPGASNDRECYFGLVQLDRTTEKQPLYDVFTSYIASNGLQRP